MKTIFLKLWAWVTGSSVALFNFLAPILASNAATLLEKLAPIALQVVASLATSDKTGPEKREAAVEEIKQAAIQQGIVAGSNVINAAIELALLNLRASEK